LKEGDRVYVTGLRDRTSTGAYAEKAVCGAASAFPLPEGVSFGEGAALGIPALTAHRALFQRGRLKPGETVLVHGASGAVGHLAVQMAAAFGARVIGTAGTPEGKDLVLRAGAQSAADHATEDDLRAITDLIGGRGPDLIIEFLANRNLALDLRLVAKYGRVVVVGNRGSLDFNPRLTMAKEADVLGTAIWNYPDDEYLQSAAFVAEAVRSGALRPHVGASFPLREARAAHEGLLSKAGSGMTVLRMDAGR
ncbi:MAG TPA: NADPH:quinone reductase, partial [Candidatus Limnocylindria bacterium]|nr:NADPH:quinone reductase [Candidatus Limnocylindria bacterium]